MTWANAHLPPQVIGLLVREFLHIALIIFCYLLMGGFGVYFWLLAPRDRSDDEDDLRPAPA